MVPTKRLRFGTFPLYSRTPLLLLLKKGRDASSSSWFHLGYHLNPKLKRGVSLSLSLFELALTRHIYIVSICRLLWSNNEEEEDQEDQEEGRREL